MRTLLAENDDLAGSCIGAGLRQAGFVVDWAHNDREAYLAATTIAYTLMILDLDVPKLSGMDLLWRLRSSGQHVPIIALTARSAASDRVCTLEAGADDCISKPFDLIELVARSRALVRRSQSRGVETIHHRNLTVNPIEQRVLLDGVHVPLSSRELAVLIQLITNPGIPQSRSKLEEVLYGWQQEVESNAIEVHICSLRRKLGPTLIRTVRGIGYVSEQK
ncbi:response regulator transcription factor [Paraburkholderia sediminicola]|uniref:response regulator n=1 Tax=Paraburkholderia sediminicola TaxID=458836 RepID=UPI0038BA4FC4